MFSSDPHCLKLGISDKAAWGLNSEMYLNIHSSCSSALQLSQHDYENKLWYNDSRTLHRTLQGKKKYYQIPKHDQKINQELEPYAKWDKRPDCTTAPQVINPVTFMSSASLQECHSALRAFQVTALQPQSRVRCCEGVCSAMKPERPLFLLPRGVTAVVQSLSAATREINCQNPHSQ